MSKVEKKTEEPKPGFETPWDGIALFKNHYVRSEEIIDLAESSGKWRDGTAGQGVNPNLRMTDIHDIDQNDPLHKDILESFIDGINEYSKFYPGLNITTGEHLRVGRYRPNGFYAPHIDAKGAERVLSGILYLNEDFEGGELLFPRFNIAIKPEEGMLVLFPSNFIYVHQSLPIKSGTKYITVTWFS